MNRLQSSGSVTPMDVSVGERKEAQRNRTWDEAVDRISRKAQEVLKEDTRTLTNFNRSGAANINKIKMRLFSQGAVDDSGVSAGKHL